MRDASLTPILTIFYVFLFKARDDKSFADMTKYDYLCLYHEDNQNYSRIFETVKMFP